MSNPTANLGSTKIASEGDQGKVAILSSLQDENDIAIAGLLILSVAGNTDITLTNKVSGTPGTQALNNTFKFTGVLTGSINVKLPATGGCTRMFMVWNATSGAFTLTVKMASGGSGVAVTQGKKVILFQDGSEVYKVAAEI